MTSETLSAGTRPVALAFHGTTREYFRVWLPGACLTWLTFGIYSAWAAIRRRQYLVAHTELDGLPFGYQARAWQVLLWRACLLLALGLAWLAFRVSDAGPWVLAGYALVFPSVLARVARFAARSRTYRGAPGEFTGSAWSFFYAAAPVLACMALSAELVIRELHRLLRPFSDAHPILVALPYVALCFWVLVSIETALCNLVAKHTRWGQLSFDSRLETSSMLWLRLTNGLASLLSFGLLIPWAEIRTRRYQLSRLRVRASDQP
jgi:uncharacterized membrane protein YjgN (DUF898 family)